MTSEALAFVFYLLVLIFSAIVHEIMHGVAADRLGDPTARYAGRLTLNPIPHIDLFGSIIVPGLLYFYSHGTFFYAWAKPVPYNPYNLKPGRFSEAIVGAAGPFSNLAIALIASIVVRLNVVPAMTDILSIIILVNVMLFAFNLIPIPPLDGSKVIEAFLPRPLRYAYDRFRRQLDANPFMGMTIVIILILLLGSLWGRFLFGLFHLISGL
jgi:Zn-dependent protease